MLALCLALASVPAATAEDEFLTLPMDEGTDMIWDMKLTEDEMRDIIVDPEAPAADPVVSNADGVAIDESHFPDAAFRSYIVEEIDNSPCDGVLSDSECAEVEYMYIEKRGIASLDGIEYFPSLTQLICDANKLTSLDLSHNTSLELVACTGNQISSLNLEKNTVLRDLHCTDNQLKSLDLSNNMKIEWLECADNRITSLDLTHCPNLILCAKGKPKVNGNDLQFFYFEEDEEGDEREYHLFIDNNVVLTANGKTLYGASEPVSIAGAKVTIAAQVYSGKALEPTPTVKLNGVLLRMGTDYTVTYKNNKKIGKATVIIKGKGHYTGKINKAFKIIPKATSLSGLTPGAKKLTVKWKKRSGVSGYIIQYSRNSSFSNAKEVTVSKAAATQKTLQGLKSKKDYYVRIRAYKTVDKVQYCSKWSKALHKKTK